MDHYVYVYIDPRNNEEFYYGKGKGSRKNTHLTSDADTEKTKRISAIRKEGLEPIIRVIARGLTNGEALLVENTASQTGKISDEYLFRSLRRQIQTSRQITYRVIRLRLSVGRLLLQHWARSASTVERLP